MRRREEEDFEDSSRLLADVDVDHPSSARTWGPQKSSNVKDPRRRRRRSAEEEVRATVLPCLWLVLGLSLALFLCCWISLLCFSRSPAAGTDCSAAKSNLSVANRITNISPAGGGGRSVDEILIGSGTMSDEANRSTSSGVDSRSKLFTPAEAVGNVGNTGTGYYLAGSSSTLVVPERDDQPSEPGNQSSEPANQSSRRASESVCEGEEVNPYLVLVAAMALFCALRMALEIAWGSHASLEDVVVVHAPDDADLMEVGGRDGDRRRYPGEEEISL